MREKRALEEKRIRSEIEEKHAEAEKRRQEYLSTPRKTRVSKTLPADVQKTIHIEEAPVMITEEAAALRMQRAWRRVRSAYSALRFQDLGLSIGRIQQADFAEATDLLCQMQVLRVTKKVLNALQLDTGNATEYGSVRTFLSAYMVLGHPNDIFSSNGQQEQDLIDKAKETLVAFESALSLVSQSPRSIPGPDDLSTLHQAYATYVAAFEAWKTRDASVLIGTMVDQFVALDVIWQAVQNDTRGEVAEDYRDGIRENQVLLLARIKRLAGHERANTLIKRAIRDSRRSRARRAPQGDIRPRPLASDESTAEAPIVSESGLSEIAEQEIPAEASEASSLASVFSIIPPNRLVVHELLLDPAFKIEVSPQSDVRSALNRTVCDNMRQAVNSGQGELWTVSVAENVRARLLKLLKPGNSMYTLISEALDPEHVRNQCRQGLFSYERFFTFMAGLLPRLCAPFRDAEIAALGHVLDSVENTGNIDIMIEKLFGLLHMIDLMLLDYTNYMIQQAAPTLIQEGPGYEQRMFAADLSGNPHGLQRTMRWWRNAAISSVTEHTQSRITQPMMLSPVAAATARFTTTYAHGLVTLALTPSPLLPSEVPETLYLDTVRLSQLRAETFRYTITGAILLTAKNILKRDIRAQWKSEAKRILDALSTPTAYNSTAGELPNKLVAIVESGKAMPPASSAHLATMITRFLSAASTLSSPTSTSPSTSATTPTDPLLTLLSTRLRTHVQTRLAATSSNERVRLATTASEALAGMGMAEFVPQIARVVEVLERVREVDLGAHALWYRELNGSDEA
jgi:hypothetical protein